MMYRKLSTYPNFFKNHIENLHKASQATETLIAVKPYTEETKGRLQCINAQLKKIQDMLALADELAMGLIEESDFLCLFEEHFTETKRKRKGQ